LGPKMSRLVLLTFLFLVEVCLSTEKQNPNALHEMVLKAQEIIDNQFPPDFQDDYYKARQTENGIISFLRDDFVGLCIDLYGEYKFMGPKLLTTLLKETDTILDIGANYGIYSVAFAKKITSGTLISFEVQEELADLLERNLEMNNFRTQRLTFDSLQKPFPAPEGSSNQRVFVASLAVAEGAAQSISLPHLDKEIVHNIVQHIEGGLKTINFGAYVAREKQTDPLLKVLPLQPLPVTQIDIDSVSLSACDLLKIDTQGTENDVLLGARLTIERFKPFMFVSTEFAEREQIQSTLEDLGYFVFAYDFPLVRRQNFHGIQLIWGEQTSPNVLALHPANDRHQAIVGIGLLDDLPQLTLKQWPMSSLDNKPQARSPKKVKSAKKETPKKTKKATKVKKDKVAKAKKSKVSKKSKAKTNKRFKKSKTEL
jgi:hypothetical protein